MAGTPTIPEHFDEMIRSNFELAIQKTDFDFSNACKMEYNVPGDGSRVDISHEATYVEESSRFQPYETHEASTSMRKYTLRPGHVLQSFSKHDKIDLGRLALPTSQAMKSIVAARNRRKNSIFIEGLDADARTGADGSLIVQFPSENIIAKNYIYGGTGSASGLTGAKMLQAMRMFDDNNVPKDRRFLACNPYAYQSILSDADGRDLIINSDYNGGKVFTNGGIATGMYIHGFQLIVTTAINDTLYNDGDDDLYKCFAFHADYAAFGENRSPLVIERLQSDGSIRILEDSSFGMVREQDKAFVKILIKA